MKKYLFLVATLLLTLSITVSAQNNNRRNDNNRRTDRIMNMSPKERADLMAKELDLTVEQTAQVEALCEKQDAERLVQVEEHRSGRGTGSSNRDARREEMRVLRLKEVERHNAELEKIIGKEKLDKWNELRQDVRDTNREGRRNPAKRNR
jgi:Spy/CpxP family protein refolding chaperone